MSLIIPFSEACERNKDPILETIAPLLKSTSKALEIGSGTGQHIVHFAQFAEHVLWQPSDQAHYLDGIRAQLQTHPHDNIAEPLEIDVTRQPWLKSHTTFDLVYTANTLHIMAWHVVEAFFRGLPAVSHERSRLVVYGPFKFEGQHISNSNRIFDATLRARGEGSAVRDFEAVDRLANQSGFGLQSQHRLPANNYCMIWQRLDAPKDLT